MKPGAIHQMLPTLLPGDAIGNHARELQKILRGWGYPSEIFAQHRHPALLDSSHAFEAYRSFSSPDNLLIYHFSIGGPTNQFALELPDRLLLDYHNITPAEFFYGYNAQLALLLADARRELLLFAGRAPAIADSEFNLRELQALNFDVLGVVTPVFGLHDRHAPDPVQAARQRQRFARPDLTSWLHVGRLAPNKCLHDLIQAFHYYHRWINPRSRLLLVGPTSGQEAYVAQLYQLVTGLGLDGAVLLTGPVEDQSVFFEMASVYVVMSEHEGFCVPLVEAMQHRLPIVAFASTAVPETLGGAGVLVRRKLFPLIAELVHEIVTNASLRQKLIARQCARLERFSREAEAATFRVCLERAMAN